MMQTLRMMKMRVSDMNIFAMGACLLGYVTLQTGTEEMRVQLHSLFSFSIILYQLHKGFAKVFSCTLDGGLRIYH